MKGSCSPRPRVPASCRDASAVTPLDPRQWRFSGSSSDPAVRGVHASRTQILSDLWNDTTAPGNGGDARTPWSNWSVWQTFVEQTVRNAERQGWAPDYWDVWNEPNGTCCPKFSPTDQQTITVARWLETYEVAWQAIKAVDKNARVIGPSLACCSGRREARRSSTSTPSSRSGPRTTCVGMRSRGTRTRLRRHRATCGRQ